MKKILLFMFFSLCMMGLSAQGNRDFDPKQFEKDLEAYIIEQSGLTQNEATKFLPVYREMRGKQREVFKKMKNKKPDFDNEKECAEAIRQHDEMDIEQKEIQSTYHNKFLKIISAKKVLKIIRAEDKFHRMQLRKAGSKQGGKGDHGRR